MTKLSILAAAVLAASAFAGSAYAESYDAQNRIAFQGQLTRAEVQAGYFAAVRDNTLPPAEGDARGVQAPVAESARNRNEVRAEAVQAARDFRNAEVM